MAVVVITAAREEVRVFVNCNRKLGIPENNTFIKSTKICDPSPASQHTTTQAKNFCYVFFLCGLEGFVLQYHTLQFRSSSLFCFPRKLSEHMLLTHRSALGIFEHLRCRMEAVRCDLRSSVLFSM